VGGDLNGGYGLAGNRSSNSAATSTSADGQVEDVGVKQARRQHLSRADRTVLQGCATGKARLYCASSVFCGGLRVKAAAAAKVRTLILARSLASSGSPLPA